MNGKPPDSAAHADAGQPKPRDLSPAARRALAEAEARRAQALLRRPPN